eukprot:1067043-Lingulodinium_polyedra.AAC.1
MAPNVASAHGSLPRTKRSRNSTKKTWQRSWQAMRTSSSHTWRRSQSTRSSGTPPVGNRGAAR